MAPEISHIRHKSTLKKGKGKHRVKSLSRLLTGSKMVEDDDDEIPSFFLDKIDDDLHLENIDLNSTIALIEQDFEGSEQHLETEERKHTHFEKIKIEEVSTSLQNDGFSIEISCRLNRGENLSFSRLRRTSCMQETLRTPHCRSSFPAEACHVFQPLFCPPWTPRRPQAVPRMRSRFSVSIARQLQLIVMSS